MDNIPVRGLTTLIMRAKYPGKGGHNTQIRRAQYSGKEGANSLRGGDNTYKGGMHNNMKLGGAILESLNNLKG